MSWIAQGCLGGSGSGGRRGGEFNDDHNCVSGGAGDGGRSLCGVPRCIASSTMCSGPGMPPRRLVQPGIDCTNGDRPCLPCDIVNLRLRTFVIGSNVKKAVAEAQKRYFCDVWNLLFSWLFPGHQAAKCRNLKPGDPPVKGRGSKKPAKTKQPGSPFGTDSSVGNRGTSPPGTSSRRPSRRPAVRDDTRRVQPGALPRERGARMSPRGRPPRSRQQRDRNSGLRYNIWGIPMLDSSKRPST